MGKRRRQRPLSDSLSDSDSDSPLNPTPPSAMDTDSRPTVNPPSSTHPSTDLPGTDPRSSTDHALTADLTSDPARHSDPRSSTDLARSHDPRPSTDHSRSSDPRTNLANAPACDSVDRSPLEPYLSLDGSFLVVKATDSDFSFRKINVFWPQKQIAAICGQHGQDIEAPANGTLVIKTHNRRDTKALLKTTMFCGQKVTVSLHQSRNSSKGTIFAPELRHMSEAEILSELRGEGVSHIRRLTTFRDGQRRDTSLLVLTFDTTTLPEKIAIGWLKKDVRVFIPNPLRCFKCQRFGHGSSTCRQAARCQRCGEAPHESSECTKPVSCLSCGSPDHSVSSSQCPTWKKEKRICEIKAQSGCSYPEARRRVEAETATPAPGRSYAKAARTETTSCSTQTDPISALPPLQCLKPLTASTTTSTNTNAATETIFGDPMPSSLPDSQPEVSQEIGQQPKPSTGAGRSTAGWMRVQRTKGPRPQPPSEDRQSSGTRTSRPPIRVAMGHNRASSWASPRRGVTNRYSLLEQQ